MKPVEDTTFLVYDGGLFVEMAVRLAKKAKRVIYQCSIDQPFPKVHEASIGEGLTEDLDVGSGMLDNMETTEDFWFIKNEIDVFCFPDCAHAGIQHELESQGKAVWGAKRGIYFELKRLNFSERLKEIGLDVKEYYVCKGITALREYLSDKTDLFIQISKFRGNMETKHWINPKVSEHILDYWAVEFGGVKEKVQFLIREPIETKVEWGLDTYFAGGRFPNIVAHGVEAKDKSYIGAIQAFDDIPAEIREIADAITPLLAQVGYAGMFSMEVRITEDGKAYLTDPTCRMPSPAGGAELELFGNFPEIVNAAAHGECIDPEPTGMFGVEVILDHNESEEGWRPLQIPDEIRDNVKLYSCCKFNDVYWVPPFPHSCDSIGSLVEVDDDMELAVQKVKDIAEAIKDQPVCANVDALVDTIEVLQAAEKEGIELTPTAVPEPEIVI